MSAEENERYARLRRTIAVAMRTAGQSTRGHNVSPEHLSYAEALILPQVEFLVNEALEEGYSHGREGRPLAR